MDMPFAKQTLDQYIAQPQPCALKATKGIQGDVLVLGAAGKMGFHLCLMLKRCFAENGQSNRVIAVSRFSSTGSRDQFEQNGIGTIACDLCNEKELAALPDAENIWFMAGVKFGTSDQPGLLHKMNVEMPRGVAQRFKTSRITALSTGCVYSFVPAESGGSREEDPVNPVGEYARSCLGRENSFRQVSEKDGLHGALIRLNYAVEMRYGVLVDIAQKVLSQIPIDISMGRFNCIWQGDALAHIIASIDLARAPADVLNVTGLEHLSIRDTAEKFGRLFGVNPVFIGEEKPTSWLSNSSRAAKLYGAPSITPDTMIRWIAEWLKGGGETFGKPTKFEVYDGNF
ncbi:MAG: NAD(P)-dependent oxidoreductase [Verrucomicrobia bacterium]|nr:NAD(P)-dependent oxidoreductase [Verrucomicrobiota bacterium]